MSVAARILSEPPISGTAPESAFNAVGEGLWVEFEDSMYEKWYGVFGSGGEGANKLLEIPDHGRILVLSGGSAYLVDVNKRITLFESEDGLVDAIYCPALERFVAVTSMGICLYGRAGLEWESGTIAHVVEGIEWLRDTIVQVRVFDSEYPFGQFRFDARTREIFKPNEQGRYAK